MVSKLLGFGIPLLDVTVEGNQLLNKYGLKSDDQILASGPLLNIFDDVSQIYADKLKYTPGGATLNAVKVVQWCLKIPNSTAVVGCLGCDDFGEILCREIKNAGVQVFFQKHPTEPTGTCLAICNGSDRSLVTYGGASRLFSMEFMHQPHIEKLVEDCQYFYSSGFTYVSCPEGVVMLAKHASKHKEKVFALNLAAPFVCRQYTKPIKDVMPYVNVLFGNNQEYDEFAAACGLQVTSRHDIALQLSKWEMEGEHALSRVVIITQGPDPVICAFDGQVQEFPPDEKRPEEIVDTTGAGDGFVGGFLASLIQKKSVEQAIWEGHHAAAVILTQRGCTLPS